MLIIGTMHSPKVDVGVIQLLFLIKQLYLSDVWQLVRCDFKHWKDVCLEEIGLCAQNMITILDPIVNLYGGDLYEHLMSIGIFTLIMNKVFLSFGNY